MIPSRFNPLRKSLRVRIQKRPHECHKKSPEDYERDRIGQYAKYFKGNNIPSIPEFVKAVELKTLSLLISDLRNRRLAGLKREGFKELIKTTGIPCLYFCRRSFATWDILLPLAEVTEKLAKDNHSNQALQITARIYGDLKKKGDC